MPGAEPITIRKPSIFNDTTYQKNKLNSRSDDPLKSIKINYSLLVTNPLKGIVISDNEWTLILTISISPSIQSGPRAELLVNGTKIGDFHGNSIIALTFLDRGNHTISIIIIDKKANVVTIGPNNNITVQRSHSRP